MQRAESRKKFNHLECRGSEMGFLPALLAGWQKLEVHDLPPTTNIQHRLLLEEEFYKGGVKCGKRMDIIGKHLSATGIFIVPSAVFRSTRRFLQRIDAQPT